MIIATCVGDVRVFNYQLAIYSHLALASSYQDYLSYFLTDI